MAPHSSTLAWKISWAKEPGRLQSMGSQRVRHDWVTSLFFSFSCIGEGNGNPLQCSCLENPRDGGAWWAAVYGVTQSQTQLKQLSSSSSSIYIYDCGVRLWEISIMSFRKFYIRGMLQCYRNMETQALDLSLRQREEGKGKLSRFLVTPYEFINPKLWIWINIINIM